jgi:hypothetical protein
MAGFTSTPASQSEVSPQSPPHASRGSVFSSSFINTDQLEAEYSLNDLKYRWIYDPQLLQLPIAASAPGNTPLGSRPAAVIVQLAAPAMELQVEFLAMRRGDKPVAPDPFALVNNDSNFVLASFNFGPQSPSPTQGGAIKKYIWVGVYHYYLLQSILPSDGQYRFGSAGYDSTPASAAVTEADDFSADIL